MQTDQSKKTNQIADFIFEFNVTGFFDSVAFPSKNGNVYSSDEINRLKAVKLALDDLNLIPSDSENMQCKLRMFTQQDLDNMGE